MSSADQSDAPRDGGDPLEEREKNEEIRKLPRGPLFRGFNALELVRIGMFASLLVAVIALREPCADGAATFVGAFEETGPDAAAPPDPLAGYELVPAQELLDRLARDGGTAESAAAAGSSSQGR